MSSFLKTTSAAIFAATMTTTASFAATVQTAAHAEYNDTGVNVATSADSDIDAASSASIGNMTAIQNADGVSRISGGDSLASGQSPAQIIGETRQKITETNGSGADLSYTLDYALTNMSFFLNGDWGGASPGPNPFDGIVEAVGGRFSYEVLLNGTSIFFAGLEAFGGGDQGYQIDNAVNASGTVINGASFGGDILIDDITGSLDLGTFGDGESFMVETILNVELLFNGYENEAYANFGDPTGINTGQLITGSQPPAVPLPAAGWMLIAGLGGLGALRRRKH